MQTCLVWCPGGSCLPSISQIWSNYISCKPCTRAKIDELAVNVRFSPDHTGRVDMRHIIEAASAHEVAYLESLQNQLESFPQVLYYGAGNFV